MCCRTMSDHDLKAYLKEHPRLLSALFGLTVLLSQVGTVAASNGNTIGGV